MKVSVVRPDELGAGELAAWRAMQRATPAFENAFLSPAFAVAAGRVRPSARVAVLEDGGDIVGFFPFERGRFRVGRPIAAGVADAQAVVHAPSLEWNAQELLEGCGLQVWEFDHLVSGQLAAAGRNVVRRSAASVDLSQGYEAYVAERLRASRKVLRSTFYKQRKLERDLGATHFEFDSRDERALEVLLGWKSAQYRRTGHRDTLATEWVRRLIWDLFRARTDGCAGTLSVLYLGERVISAHFGLRCDSVLSCWFPAYDVGLARYSPGLTLHLSMAEAAAADGIRYLDLGKGDEEYKSSLKTGDVPVGEGWIDRPSPAAVARRIQREPGRRAIDFILRHPPLRRAARRTLRRIASLRSAM
jgi:CelD/BcsL family acetyltransferase involved in cellulose biosynthesis